MIDGFRDGESMHVNRPTWSLPLCLLLPLLLLLWPTTLWSPARAAPDPPPSSPSVPAIGRTWPVGTRPAVVRAWEPPPTAYARGHRGVDLAAPPGAPVRAVAAGVVSYAGRVAGRGVISVTLTGTNLRTTYEPVRQSVTKGTEVTAGQVVGTVEPTGSHCTTPCLHWGLRHDRTYVDPLSLFPPWLLRKGPSRLLPVLGVPLPG
ncbi:M23 family metallopeptidase [Streptomyces antibioticus]|uniref:Peptidase M23 n=2 Tax=Streptomyces antibioticus TaxID=1890 RepID=A0ABX3LEC1_STRAT|nr:M23 family metallopeptidase [Streptomyces antibioticus]OOQ48752.1 peptidase M23 [Streptomyces antibioticus]